MHRIADALANSRNVTRAAAAVIRELDRARLGEVIADQALLLGATAVHLFEVDEQRGEMRLVTHRGLPPELESTLARVPLDAPLTAARAARTRQIQAIEDLAEVGEDLVLSRRVLEATGTGSMLAVPLPTHGRLVAVLTWMLDGPQIFDEDDVAALRELGEVFAAALARAQSFERERALSAQLEAVNEAGVGIGAPQPLESVLQLLLEQARRITGAEYAALGLLDPEDPDGPFSPWAYSGMPQETARRIGRRPRPVGLLGAVPRGEESIRLARLQDDPRFHGMPEGLPPMTSFLGVPVRLHGRALGNLFLTNKRGAPEFSRDDQRAVELLAQLAGAALAQARSRELLLQENAERRRAESALRDSEARYRLLSETARDVVFRLDLAPRPHVAYVSPAITALTGHPPEAFYADPELPLRLVEPEDRHLMAQVPKALEPGTRTFRMRRSDGALVWVEVHTDSLRDPSGMPLGVVGIARDVTGRVQVEQERQHLVEALAAERSWLQAVIDHSPVGVLLFDRDGTMRANARASELMGGPLSPEHGATQYRERLRHPDGRTLSVEELPSVRARHGATVANEEFVILREDRAVPVLVSAAPIRADDGSSDGAMLVVQDVSALKELERMREEWTAVVAHDLRQPVTLIAMQAGLLARHATDERSRRKLDHILTSAHNLSRMIGDLLDMARLEANRLTLSRQRVDLLVLLRDLVDRRAPELGEHPVLLSLPDTLPPLDVDPGRLEQIVGNLLSNAAKYGYRDTEILLEAKRHDTLVVVSITNRGQGIAPDEVRQLFDRFYRTRRAREGKVAGIGLGLYITRKLVEAHGGRIWAESVPKETTTFHFSLPLPA